MKMNKLALACGVAMLGLSSVAAADVSMNIGATSNYIWRGLTQTNNDSAISGGLDYTHASGFYLGTWASTANWAPGMTYELDLYGGFSGEYKGFGYDASILRYSYDQDVNADFTEFGLSGSWQFLSAGLNYTFSADNSDQEGDMYYYAGVSFDLPQDFSIGGTVGHYNFDDSSLEDYSHYQVDLTKSAGDFGDVTLTLSDTNLKDTAPSAGGDSDPRFLVSWSKTF